MIILGMSQSEAVACQRQMLKKKLGLGIPGSMDLGIDSLLDDEDLVAETTQNKMMAQLSTEVCLYCCCDNQSIN